MACGGVGEPVPFRLAGIQPRKSHSLLRFPLPVVSMLSDYSSSSICSRTWSIASIDEAAEHEGCRCADDGGHRDEEPELDIGDMK